MELTKESSLVKTILEYAGGTTGKIVILPTASNMGKEVGAMYTDFFSELCDDVTYHLIDTRDDAHGPELLRNLSDASLIFFTGGDQLKITSLLGGSPVMEIVRKARSNNVLVAGTSAGATAMSNTMITYGPADSMLKGNLKMSPGMGLVENIVIDSHFVKRGRISRLLHMVAQNPGMLGVGLSEDTGILVDPDSRLFEVLGSRQVVVVDGRKIRHANIAAVRDNRPFSVTDVRVHVLGPKYRYNYQSHEITIPVQENYDLGLEKPSELGDLPYRPMDMNDW